MDNLSYFCFSTPRNKYMYVRNINSIIRIPEEEYQELMRVRKENDDRNEVVKKYKRLGIFVENPIEMIEHPDTDTLEFRANHLCRHLTLQVTQQCNLRCEYCAYSGIYKNRVHNNRNMDWSTAKKAIDFFLLHSRDSKEIALGFYGGEPLLQFSLIKRCVAYIEEQVEGKNIRYAITTNGTLLSEEVIEFLVEHNVLLSISLDGSKEEHDKHRKFQSGKGSFDLIMERLRHLKERFPEYYKDITFMPVISADVELKRVLHFFETDELLKNNTVRYNTVVTTGLKPGMEDKVTYDEEKFNLFYDFEYLKMLLAIIGKIPEEKVSSLVYTAEYEHNRFYGCIDRHDILRRNMHHGGPCVPGVARLFVAVNGDFYPCEKVSEDNPEYRIGNLETGFDIREMNTLLNIGNLTRKECQACWNIANCNICASNLPPGDHGLDREKKLSLCEEQKRSVMNYIYDTAVLTEFCKLNEWNGVKILG